jgi:hypothetical protein
MEQILSEPVELTEVELHLVTGGLGVAAFSFTNTASGTNAVLLASLSRLLQSHSRARREPLFLCRSKIHCFCGSGAEDPRRFRLDRGFPTLIS